MGQIANQMALELFFKIKEKIKEKRKKNFQQWHYPFQEEPNFFLRSSCSWHSGDFWSPHPKVWNCK